MGLQVRLVHALADRVLDLEPVGGKPLIIGRAADADIQIPSLNVSRRHAILHAREDGWVLQDGGGGRGTFVNGQPLTGSIALKSGDVVTLGTDPTPATLVIDPYGEAGGARPPAAATDQPPSAARRRSASPTGGGLPQPTLAPAAPSPRSMRPNAPLAPTNSFAVEPVAGEEGDVADEWMAAAAVESRAPGRKPPKKQGMSPGLIAATVTLTLLIIGGATWLYIKRSREAKTIIIVQAAPDTKKRVTPTTRKGDVFSQMEADRILQSVGGTPETQPAPAAPAPKEAVTSSVPPSRATLDLPPELSGKAPGSKSATPAAMDDDLNPGTPIKASAAAADRYWNGVEEAHNISEPVVAVVIYEDYLKLFPDGAHVSEVNQFMDEALDQLWWQRIADLMKKKQEIEKDTTKKDAEIAAETSAEFKEKLVAEKAELAKNLEVVSNELKAMKYDLQDPPNTHDPAALKLLRQGRDPQVYETWKKSVHARIKNSRGARVF